MVIDFNKGNGGGGSGYTLPIASEQQLGGIKVGSGLSITSGGVLSADGVDLTNYVQEQELSGYQTTQAMSGYQTTQAMSAYQTTQGMSGYVETSAMSGYATTDSLSAYTPSSAMSDYLTVSDYHNDVDDVLEQNIKTLYGNDAAVGMAYLWNDGGSEKAKVFKVTDSGTSVDDYTYYQPSRNTKAPQPEGWVVDKSEQIPTIDPSTFSQPAIVIDGTESKFGYVDEEEGVAHFLVVHGDGVFEEWYDKTEDPETGYITWNSRGLEPIGSEEIEKASFTNWGTLKLANGIALEVNDSDEGQGVVLGVSAGENYVFGNSKGAADNGGAKAPIYHYTQYDLDIYDDYDNSISFEGEGNISLNIYIDGQDGNVVMFDDGTRYMRIYCSGSVCYLEASAKNQRGAKSSTPTTATTIVFNTSSPYKDFTIKYDGNGYIGVYESYDNYDTPIAELSDVDFGVRISHIQLFDKSTIMDDTGIGTISINNTDYIKPYYEYDGDTVTNVGFVLRKRSCVDM